MNILDKYIKEKHFFSDPFPHIVIDDCLDQELYNLLDKNFPENEKFNPKVKEENSPYWIIGSDLQSISNVWKAFIRDHISLEFYKKATEIIEPFMKDLDPNYIDNIGKEIKDCSFGLAESGRENNPANKQKDILISVSAGINTPCKNKSIIDPPHCDFPQKLFNALLYMRKEDDDSFGGDLTLYQVDKNFLFTGKNEFRYEVDSKYLKAIKTIKYAKNTLVLFPQKISAIHGVTARGPTTHTRRYINIYMESYVLKRKRFFETPRSISTKIKFKLINILGVLGLKKILRPFYRLISNFIAKRRNI